MFTKKKVPQFTIGSHVRDTRPSVPIAPISTVIQPLVMERAGDTLGNLLWKSVPVVTALASVTVAAMREFSPTDKDGHLPWTYIPIDPHDPDDFVRPDKELY